MGAIIKVLQRRQWKSYSCTLKKTRSLSAKGRRHPYLSHGTRLAKVAVGTVTWCPRTGTSILVRTTVQPLPSVGCLPPLRHGRAYDWHTLVTVRPHSPINLLDDAEKRLISCHRLNVTPCPQSQPWAYPNPRAIFSKTSTRSSDCATVGMATPDEKPWHQPSVVSYFAASEVGEMLE